MTMFEYTEEIWSGMNAQDDSDWPCYCGNDLWGLPMPEHKVSEHNAVTYAVRKVADEQGLKPCDAHIEYNCKEGCE